jgi:hypothetical protein
VLPQPAQYPKTVDPWRLDIQEDEVWNVPLDFVPGIGAIGRIHDGKALREEKFAQNFAARAVIFCNQNFFDGIALDWPSAWLI